MMAQSFIAGGTNYSEQSINDIKSDIEFWMSLCKRIKSMFERTITELKEQNYWEQNVAVNFKGFCYNVPRICDTFCADFEIVLKSITNDKITSREIALMRNIYKVSDENEEYSWKSFKGNDERWHDYGNPLFEKVEELYEQGRDFFVTLRDVGNAVSRMEDYMKIENEITNVDNSVHVDNSITLGDNNEISNSVIGHANTDDKSEEKESFFHKYMWPIISGVAIAVIAALVCLWLGLE